MTDLLARAEVAELERDRREARAEAAWEAQREAIAFEANEDLRTPDGVKTLIEEDWLAHHIAGIFWNLENATKELEKLQGDTISIRGLLRAVNRMHDSFMEQKVEEMTE